jgi:hypothetical protein
MLKESIGADLKKAYSEEIGKSNVVSQGGIDAVITANEFKNEIPENKKLKIIKRPMKKGIADKLVGKPKINKPIGKLTSSLPIMGEDKSAKSQFKKDLQKDSDFKKFKEKDNEFGTPNVSQSDPFIKKSRYKRVGKEENKESTGSGSAGGYSGPLFSATKKEMNEEYCDSCDRVKSKCVCGETKKVEATEATGSGSSGSYETTSAWAKLTNKKDWGGRKKTQIPGGKFVQVKKKCQKFPYCNQGDIKALKIFENEKVKKAIQNISQRHNISENVIKTIIAYEYENTFSK